MIQHDIYQDVPLSELRKRLSPTPSVRSLQRWAKNGVESRTGRTVFLPVVKLPSGNGSSVAKYLEFVEELQR